MPGMHPPKLSIAASSRMSGDGGRGNAPAGMTQGAKGGLSVGKLRQTKPKALRPLGGRSLSKR